MKSVIIPPQEFLSYHNQMRDVGAQNFVPNIPNSEAVSFGVSRLLCDVERLTDGTEIMDKYGMGFCYQKVYDGKTIKHVTSEIKKRTYKYYQLHHNKIDHVMQLHKSGAVLLIDLHSFSEQIIVKDLQTSSKPIPDVCLGYDEKFCPPRLAEIAKKCMIDRGFTVDINYPYMGSFVPNSVLSGQIKTPFASIMIEVNKSKYMKNGQIDSTAVRKIKNAVFEMIALYSEICFC